MRRDTTSGFEGETIRYAVADSTLGPVLIAATARGLCAIEFGEDLETLREAAAIRFAGAHLVETDDEFERWAAATLAYLAEPTHLFEVPLDIRGTDFQQLIWGALREIPAGQTRSYSEVATQVGKPTGSRAVATACAANHLAVVVPCHRVVRADGAISGYRWGVDRKRELLSREGISPAR